MILTTKMLPLLAMMVLVNLSLRVFAQIDHFSIEEQCQNVKQDATAGWRTIGWETDLLKAQNLAVESNKPMFIWAMDGHPLGCT